MKHVVSVSSGLGSAYAWKLVLAAHGNDDVIGVFTDVNGEHPDNYRFLADVTYALDGRLVKLHNDGRNIWDVMIEGRFLANTRVDLCSRILKREAMYSWLEDRFDPADTIVHLGFDKSEEHRFLRAVPYWAEKGWTIAAPLCDPEKYILKSDAQVWLDEIGVKRPFLYDLGFSHANCGGGCVKAGIGQFKQLLLADRRWYVWWWERGEERVRTHLGKDVTILRDRSAKSIQRRLGLADSELATRVVGWDDDGEPVAHETYVKATGLRLPTTLPLSLRRLRELVDGDPQLRLEGDDEFGACDCFTAPPDEVSTLVTIGATA